MTSAELSEKSHTSNSFLSQLQSHIIRPYPILPRGQKNEWLWNKAKHNLSPLTVIKIAGFCTDKYPLQTNGIQRKCMCGDEFVPRILSADSASVVDHMWQAEKIWPHWYDSLYEWIQILSSTALGNGWELSWLGVREAFRCLHCQNWNSVSLSISLSHSFISSK